MGPQKDVQSYFENLGFIFKPTQNPADVLMDILSGKAQANGRALTPMELVEKWNTRSNKKDSIVSDKAASSMANLIQLQKSRTNASYFKQFWLAHNRSIIQQFRNYQALALEIGVGLLAGALMGNFSSDIRTFYNGNEWRNI